MPLPPAEIAHQRLRDRGAEVHSLHIDSEGSIIVYDATYEPHSGKIPSLPALFMMLCVSGGGRITQKTRFQDLDAIIEPGDIGISAPSSGGVGSWPELRVVGVGIEITTLLESFGEKWPNRLRKEFISAPFRDPLVETTMMQIGYTQSGKSSDSVLKYAAQMIVHRLLDDPFEKDLKEALPEGVQPLPHEKIESIEAFVQDNLSRQIQVDELAVLAGVSRYHFSRRFKAATGITPYQLVLQKKLDHAARSLSTDSSDSVIDIAQSVGFENPAQFAKAFRRRFGLAPRLWRKRGA